MSAIVSAPYTRKMALDSAPVSTSGSREPASARTNGQQDADRSTASTSASTSKPDLSLHVDASPTLSPGGSSGSFMAWQQPYSELSRFPSASHRFRPGREKEWPPEGSSQFMTPLPSPSIHSRDRSISDAASEASFVSDGGISTTSSSRPAAAGNSSSNTTNNFGSSTSSARRNKTKDFFGSSDTAMSPPPPPRIASADYDHSKKELWTPSSLSSSFAALGATSAPPPVPPPFTTSSSYSNTPQSSYPATRAATRAGTASFVDSPTVVHQPMSNLPSAFRSEGVPARTNNAAPTPPVASTSQHRRVTSSGSNTFTPSGLSRSSHVVESPLASPTDSQSSRWTRDPPSRLPTLLPEPSPDALQISPPASDFFGVSSNGRNVMPPKAVHTESPLTPKQEQNPSPSLETETGTILNGEYEVLRHLGLGSFSRVVLAKKKSLMNGETAAQRHSRVPSDKYPAALGKGHIKTRSRTGSSQDGFKSGEPLVAIKLISKSHIKKNDRMRISIIREVEVLKHIRHPSLVHLTSSFDTPYHTCLVLEYAAGGELFDFIANYHEQTSEALVRRIFGELADVLGWMHSIGLVHRDIKLENILLTRNPFADTSYSTTDWPNPASLPFIPTPLVKLTDFGLSRFVDLSSPFLETRCGSEEYAAPELIMGKRYDGRQTDSWALGVVLYALLVGYLPFVEDAALGNADTPSRAQASPSTRGTSRSRKAYLLKIAKGEYAWPKDDATDDGRLIVTDHTRMVNEHSKALVGGLLTRDPKKRLRTEEIWDLDWMAGPGMPEKRFVRGGGLEGVALTAFEQGDVAAAVRAEVPDPG